MATVGSDILPAITFLMKINMHRAPENYLQIIEHATGPYSTSVLIWQLLSSQQTKTM
jgi:hypothetical protein